MLKHYDSPADLLNDVAKTFSIAAALVRRDPKWANEKCGGGHGDEEEGDFVVMLSPNLNDGDFVYEMLHEMLKKAWQAETAALDFICSQGERDAAVEASAEQQ